MGAFLDKPNTEKHNEVGNGNGLRYGVASMQGWRLEMEDAHQAIIGLPGSDEQSEELKQWSYFAVFDGHAGAKISAHCSAHLLESILQTEEFKHEDFSKGIRSGFLRLDSTMRALPDIASGENKSGSTAVCALISPKQIFIANCGDSRALLCRSGKVPFATRDHKPFDPSETARIQNAGGNVIVHRVNGALAVSRALGDYEYKNVEGKGQCEQLVSPEPEVTVLDRVPEEDEFLVLACDGVWDVMKNEPLAEYIRTRLLVSDDLQSICNQVIDTCLFRGSRDNMSIVLVTFPASPKVSEEAVQKEAELEATLKQHVIELVSKGKTKYSDLLNALDVLDIPNLPFNGEISSKRTYIEKLFRELYPEYAASISDGPAYGALPE